MVQSVSGSGFWFVVWIKMMMMMMMNLRLVNRGNLERDRERKGVIVVLLG